MLDPKLLNLKLQPKVEKFLKNFPQTLYCYIPDHNDKLPVIHSEILDLKRQKDGYGIFFTVNGFTGGKRTSETLTNINGFFCDIDYPDKINKTAEAIRLYKQDLLMEMVDEGLVPTYIVETKNGFHVYWMLPEPIYLNTLNPEQQNRLRVLYRDIEEAILKKFDGDPAAKDVARVLRVPGTLHQKNPNDPFEVKLSHAYEENVYKFSEIQEYFLKKPPMDTWAAANGENPINEEVKLEIEKKYPKLDRPSFKALLSKQPGTVPEGLRNKALLVVAYACKEAGWSFDQTTNHFNEFHGLGLREIRKTIRSAFEHSYDFGYNNEVMQAIVKPEERVALSEVTSKVLSKTTKEKRDSTNNQQKEKYLTYEFILAERYPYLKYKMRGDFYQYESGVYVPRQIGDIQSLVLNEMLGDGLTNYRKISAVNDKIACFKSIPGRTFTHEEEDSNHNILNFKNALVDISTYQMHPHTPLYLSTSQIPVDFEHTASCPQWKSFVYDIMDGDQDQVKLLQQIAGYCLTGSTTLAKAFVLFGSGANGKSLFTRMIAKIVGQQNVSSVNLTALNKQFGLTGLIGKKLNLIDEISGNYFESNIIKGLISGEKMSAEIKYRPEPLEFHPTTKLIFSVNELPKINDTTPGLYRRFIIIPFNRTYLNNPDIYLEDKLTKELPGILNWAIEGLKMLREQGRFNETEKNFEMMNIFKMDNSPMIEFLQSNYDPVPVGQELKYVIKSTSLYQEYKSYCLENGYKPKSLANFGREMNHSTMVGWNIGKIKDGSILYYSGLRRNQTVAQEDIRYPDQPGFKRV